MGTSSYPKVSQLQGCTLQGSRGGNVARGNGERRVCLLPLQTHVHTPNWEFFHNTHAFDTLLIDRSEGNITLSVYIDNIIGGRPAGPIHQNA